MKLQLVIEKINENQKLIDVHGKLSQDLLNKVNNKFRLDWNYYSNRMEGGTLTREETRSVMVGNIDVHGKPFKDVMEMKGHHETVLEILKVGKGECRISEKRIRVIHQAIMFEEDPLKKAEIGNWKTKPNELINYKGEKISFTQPYDVQPKIHDLLNRTNADMDAFFTEKKSRHPLELASDFHLDFVAIHPFYDGNGRTSRILTNLILVSCGFPPIIIKEKHTRSYYQLLADIQSYGGNRDLFHIFIGERLLESQQLVLDALNGKSIEEEDDIDKEIDLWKRALDQSEPEVLKKSDSEIIRLYVVSIRPMCIRLLEKLSQFNDLFVERNVINTIGSYSIQAQVLEVLDKWIGFKEKIFRIESDTELDSVQKQVEINLLRNNATSIEIQEASNIGIVIRFFGFKKSGLNIFDEMVELVVDFHDFHFTIYKNKYRSEIFVKKLYSEKLSESEITEIVNSCVKDFFEKIKERTN